MPPLISLKEISLSFGHVPLLERVNLNIEAGERVCLVGRNGAGKSSLMKVIQGQVNPDDGELWRREGLRVAYLEQEVPGGDQRSVFEVVASGLSELGQLIGEYHHVIKQLEQSEDAALVHKLSELQHALEAADGWRIEQKIESVISRLDLPADTPISELSGGIKRRTLLARALVSEPDLLLLDEPTNHLDIAGITWLEEFMLGFKGALLFITHDRTFLQNLATRIIELDRGELTSWPGDYAHYLRKKDERLATEIEHNAKFDKKLAQEEAWIRQGIKARRTRNEGRVRALKAMRDAQRQRRGQQGRASLKLAQAESSGRLVADVYKATVAYGDKVILKGFSTRIMRGDRIGIIGPNGVGKSTLIKLLLGELKPQQGKVKLGTKLQVAYFDQQRAILDPEKSVMENLNDGSEYVSVQGRNRHAIGYLRDFLFPPQRVHSPVKSLSGGERNRLLLARLFTRPANLLVLDEPTNDLDVETLELLEELLSNYDGTLLLVSHDRTFLDNVVTSTLVFEQQGQIGEYVGGYQDWYDYRQAHPLEGEPVQAEAVKQQGKAQTETAASQQAVVQAKTENKPKQKLSYKDQRELDALPGKIESLEAQQQTLQAEVSQPDFYQQDSDEIAQKLKQLETVSAELETAYQRWEALE